MKKFPTLLLSIVCLPVLAFGGQIFGNLKANNVSVQWYALVRVVCPSSANPYEPNRDAKEQKTDAYGAYTLLLPKAQECSLIVYYDGRWSSNKVDVYSNEDPVRYDFDLVIHEDKSFIIKRR